MEILTNMLVNIVFLQFLAFANYAEGFMFQSADTVKFNAVDECAENLDDCHEDADCFDTRVYYFCVCKEGYFGDGRYCRDVNECHTKSNNCSADAVCLNTKGSFECSCKDGFSGNGTHCESLTPKVPQKKQKTVDKTEARRLRKEKERKRRQRQKRIARSKHKREKRIKRAHKLRARRITKNKKEKLKIKRALKEKRRLKKKHAIRGRQLNHLMPDLERPVITLVFPVPVEKLFTTMFGDDSSFYEKWIRKIHSFDITIGSWEQGVDEFEGNFVRDLDYKVELQEVNLFIPEGYIGLHTKQVHFGSSEEGARYVVDNLNYMDGIPFSETFHSLARHSFRSLSKHESELKVTCELRFKNEPWAFLKDQLEENVFSEFDLNYKILGTMLHSTFEG